MVGPRAVATLANHVASQCEDKAAPEDAADATADDDLDAAKVLTPRGVSVNEPQQSGPFAHLQTAQNQHVRNMKNIIMGMQDQDFIALMRNVDLSAAPGAPAPATRGMPATLAAASDSQATEAPAEPPRAVPLAEHLPATCGPAVTDAAPPAEPPHSASPATSGPTLTFEPREIGHSQSTNTSVDVETTSGHPT